MKAATVDYIDKLTHTLISIHAAREGGDAVERLIKFARRISIHAAREGGDLKRSACQLRFRISIHAAREGGDNRQAEAPPFSRYFNPRRP